MTDDSDSQSRNVDHLLRPQPGRDLLDDLDEGAGGGGERAVSVPRERDLARRNATHVEGDHVRVVSIHGQSRTSA